MNCITNALETAKLSQFQHAFVSELKVRSDCIIDRRGRGWYLQTKKHQPRWRTKDATGLQWLVWSQCGVDDGGYGSDSSRRRGGCDAVAEAVDSSSSDSGSGRSRGGGRMKK